MGWTTHTEAGGDTTEGQGGTPAFVGFNAGNGTNSYEYKPYSQVIWNFPPFLETEQLLTLQAGVN